MTAMTWYLRDRNKIVTRQKPAAILREAIRPMLDQL
jgi:hypothetical protein